MMVLEKQQIFPLNYTKEGTIRIGNSRVSLDSIVYHFKLGASAEQIFQKFPSLTLSEIYATISYYLSHQIEIEEYLERQEIEMKSKNELIAIRKKIFEHSKI